MKLSREEAADSDDDDNDDDVDDSGENVRAFAPETITAIAKHFCRFILSLMMLNFYRYFHYK